MNITGATYEEAWPLIKCFHYSKRMPSNVQHIYAVRENGGLFGDFGDVVAVAVWCLPPTRWGEPVLELSRLVKKPGCGFALSGLLAKSRSYLKTAGWSLLVSFADSTQGHHGGIYQASGWKYDGKRERRMDGLVVNGKFVPGRSCNSAWGTQSPSKLSELMPHFDIVPHYDTGKHLYWCHLNVAGKTRAKRLGLTSKPYPKPDNAARPLDAHGPPCVSQAQPLGAAP